MMMVIDVTDGVVRLEPLPESDPKYCTTSKRDTLCLEGTESLLIDNLKMWLLDISGSLIVKEETPDAKR